MLCVWHLRVGERGRAGAAACQEAERRVGAHLRVLLVAVLVGTDDEWAVGVAVPPRRGRLVTVRGVDGQGTAQHTCACTHTHSHPCRATLPVTYPTLPSTLTPSYTIGNFFKTTVWREGFFARLVETKRERSFRKSKLWVAKHSTVLLEMWLENTSHHFHPFTCHFCFSF